MSKVSITRSLLDDLAVSISTKSGEPVPMTLTEMKDAVDSISSTTVEALSVTSNGTYTAPTGKAYTPVTVNVSAPSPSLQSKTVSYTPTESAQTESVSADSGYDGLDTVSITVNAMPSGTAGTPTATKGTVSNHSVSVTPSVTNQTGYITGSTKTGTAVTVSASELVSGSETKTENGTYDVTNLAELIVNVSGGGGGATNVVLGEFTVPTYSSSNPYGDISIPYTGNGYPVAAMIYVKNGAYNSTGASTWYNGIKRYAIGFWAMSKSNTTTTPAFISATEDNGTVVVIYKNSTSSADSYTRALSMDTPCFSTSDPAGNSAFCIRFKGNAKTIRYRVANGTSSTYGLYPQVTYVYQIVYSS